MVRISQGSMVGLLGLLVLLFATPAQALDDSAICGIETARQETALSIPNQLLHAIALVESGRWDSDRRASFAWPWTVMAEGQGRFLPSKADAIMEVRKLQARGVKNIDVGCMQVNLQAHPDAFATLDDAFNPTINVAYAARFLVGLQSSTQNWATSAAYYHSQTPGLADDYKSKILATWKTIKSKNDDRLQMASVMLDAPQNRPPVGINFVNLPVAAIAPIRVSKNHEEAEHHAALDRTLAERAEAKRIADAYRQARLEEYKLRKNQATKS